MNKKRLRHLAGFMREALLENMSKEAANGWFDRLLVLGVAEAMGCLPLPLTAENIRLGRLDASLMPVFSGFPAETPEALEGLLSRMKELPREVWERPETAGWLYQYFMTEEREAVIDPLHGKAYRKEDIPVATQVFTPEWLVRFITDNSLGRVLKRADKPLESIRVMDPCVGTGHFLLYAFDLLLKAYLGRGESMKNAAEKILKHNLYGLDIDPRVVRLARFSLLLKARECGADPERLSPSVYSMPRAAKKGTGDREYQRLASVMANADECGSLIMTDGLDLLYLTKTYPEDPLVRVAELLSCRYDAVLTNPPYMTKYSPELKNYVLKHYADYRGDLFSVFIYRCLTLCREDGFVGMVTPKVWMFIKKHEALRRHIVEKRHIVTLLQLAKGSFFKEAAVDLCAFVLESQPKDEPGVYYRLDDFRGDMELQEEKLLAALESPHCPYRYEVRASRFASLPGMPVAYFVSDRLLSAFESTRLGDLSAPRQGLATGCNDRFLRCWYEVERDRICPSAKDRAEAVASGKRWFPYNKGGEYRKWYGNDLYTVNWERDGEEIRAFRDDKGALRSRPQNMGYYFRESISWSLVSSGAVAFRYKPQGQIFDIAGMSCFADGGLLYLLALGNSKVALAALEILAPTVNYQAGDIAAIPVIQDDAVKERVEALAEENISLSKEDWDAFETSREFRRHPLV